MSANRQRTKPAHSRSAELIAHPQFSEFFRVTPCGVLSPSLLETRNRARHATSEAYGLFWAQPFRRKWRSHNHKHLAVRSVTRITTERFLLAENSMPSTKRSSPPGLDLCPAENNHFADVTRSFFSTLTSTRAPLGRFSPPAMAAFPMLTT